MRTLWEYFKVTNVIETGSEYKKLFRLPLLASNENDKEKGFSMIRLQKIAQQREIFSSLESLTAEDDKEEDGQQLCTKC